MMLALLSQPGIMSHYDSFYPDVTVVPRFDFDGEVESIDIFIDNIQDAVHCEEFSLNDELSSRIPEKRFEANRKVALRELTPGLYNEDGNPIQRKKKT
jgi:hypothetical protein